MSQSQIKTKVYCVRAGDMSRRLPREELPHIPLLSLFYNIAPTKFQVSA